MATFRNESFQRLVEGALKQTACVLDDAGIDFCLIGSVSAWVRGAPESSHDLDFGIRPEDTLKTAAALEAAGYHIEIPPEDWLFKAWIGAPHDEGSIMVDFIYNPSGLVIDDDLLCRAKIMDVLAHKMRVLDVTDLMTMKLLSLREQHLNYTSCISTVRSVREQIDWTVLRSRTSHSPYAAAFFTMCEGLNIAPLPDVMAPVSRIIENIDPFVLVDGPRSEMVKMYRRSPLIG